MTGHADLYRRAQHVARFAGVAIVLAQMHAIRAQTLGQADAVIDDESDLAVGADTLERLGQLGRGVLIHVLDAELEGRNRPGIERARQPVGKAAGHVERRDQVKLAGRPPHVAHKGVGELRIEGPRGSSSSVMPLP